MGGGTTIGFKSELEDWRRESGWDGRWVGGRGCGKRWLELMRMGLCQEVWTLV